MESCIKCGKQLRKTGQKFCQHCGAAQRSPAPSEKTEPALSEKTAIPEASAQAPKKSLRMPIIIGVASVSVVLALVIVLVLINKKPKSQSLAESKSSTVIEQPISTPKPTFETKKTIPDRVLNDYATPYASSSLKGKTDTYGPHYTLDKDMHTAWNEGVNGDGIGEWLEFRFDRQVVLTRFTMVPGFNKNISDNTGDRFYKNNRVRSATLKWENGSQSIRFKDKREMQSFDLPQIKVTSIKLVIDSVFSGSKWDDTSISEVELWGYEASGANYGDATDSISIPSWVITAGAFGSKSGAEKKAEKLKSMGFNAGTLWIPDYSSLSGAKMWLAFVGPLPYQDKEMAKSLVVKVRSTVSGAKDAYGIKVDQSGKREVLK